VAVGDTVPVPGVPFGETLASASPDLLREMIRGLAQRMMDAEVEGLCGAAYGEVSPERVNSRNGYRRREWDTRAGTTELAIPKLRRRAATRSGCWSGTAGRSGRWPRWWRRRTC
jgi:putative transposase